MKTNSLPTYWKRRGTAYAQPLPNGTVVIGLRQGSGYFRLHDGNRNSVTFTSLEAAERTVAKINASPYITVKYWAR